MGHQYNITPSKNNKKNIDEAGSITSAHSIISAFSARKNKQGSIKSKVSGIYKKWKESSSFKSKDSVSVHNGMFAGSKLRPSIFRELGCVEINGKSLYHPVDIGDNHNGSQGEEKFTNYLSKNSILSNHVYLNMLIYERPAATEEKVEGYINVFLPTKPPKWNYWWAEVDVQNKMILLKTKPDDSRVEKHINLTDYRYVEIAKNTLCSRPYTIRLMKNKDEIERTLITLENSTMLAYWMLNINLILKYEESWRNI